MTFELRVFSVILFVVIAAVFGAALKWREATVAWLARWAAPIIMGVAYLMLMITSDTDATGKAWMTIGFGIVLVVWVLIRLLTARAALARAF
ncbi:MAG: hypothetical protein NT062_33880, partial [Proteobacteria bacterium]|nr:hypothetical protein [Pseudomonadota bacterium]